MKLGALRRLFTAVMFPPRRNYQTNVSGPSRYPISTGHIILLGGGILSLCMVSLWGVFTVPKYADIHDTSGPAEGASEAEKE